MYFQHAFCTSIALHLVLPPRCDSISGQSKGFAFSTHSQHCPLLVWLFLSPVFVRSGRTPPPLSTPPLPHSHVWSTCLPQCLLWSQDSFQYTECSFSTRFGYFKLIHCLASQLIGLIRFALIIPATCHPFELCESPFCVWTLMRNSHYATLVFCGHTHLLIKVNARLMDCFHKHCFCKPNRDGFKSKVGVTFSCGEWNRSYLGAAHKRKKNVFEGFLLIFWKCRLVIIVFPSLKVFSLSRSVIYFFNFPFVISV